MVTLLSTKKSKKALNKNILVFIFLVLIFAATLTIKYANYSIARVVATPFIYIGTGIRNSASFVLVTLRSKQALTKENQILKGQVEELKNTELDHDLLLKENESLKAELGRSEKPQLVFARVLTKPNFSLYDSLIVDKGESDIALGAYVYAPGDIPVGTVDQITGKTARVILFSSPERKTLVRIDGYSIDTELVGRGGGNFEIKIPHEIVLTKDTKVLLPSLYSKVIALVKATLGDEREKYERVLLVSPVNIQELDTVFIQK